MKESKEFWDIDVAKSALMLLDNYELLEKIFQNAPFGAAKVLSLSDTQSSGNPSNQSKPII